MTMPEEPPTQSSATPTNDLGVPETEERAAVEQQINQDVPKLDTPEADTPLPTTEGNDTPNSTPAPDKDTTVADPKA